MQKYRCSYKAFKWSKNTIRMCMPKNSRFCLLCLFLWLWLPSPSSSSLDESGKTNLTAESYVPLAKDASYEPDETEYLQLNQSTKRANEHDDSKPQHYYLHSLMEKYGNGFQITFEGFEHLLENIGLGKFLVFDHDVDCHKVNGSEFIALHGDHNHSSLHQSDDSRKPCHTGDDHVTHSHDHHDAGDAESHLSDTDHDHGGDKTEDAHKHDHVTHSHDHHDAGDAESHLGDTDHNHGGDETEDAHKHDHEATEEQHAPLARVRRHIMEETKKQCLSPKLIFQLFNNAETTAITEDLFTDLCPVLIYQLDKKTCVSNSYEDHHDEGHEGHHHDDHEHEHDDHEHQHDDHEHQHDDHEHQHNDHEHPPAAKSEASSGFDLSNIPAKVWGFSTIAVVIISLVGLLGVAVIPIMQKVFYNHLLQFLVALAVGALTGDALLHLLPHAIQGGHSDEGHGGHGDHGDETGGHDMSGVYKGLVGLMGIYFFFIIERTVTIITDIKRKRKQKSKRSQRNLKGNSGVGEKLANSDMECGEMMMSIHPNKALQGYADEAHSEHCKISFENTTIVSHLHENATVKSHEHGAHGHGNHGNHEDEEGEGQSMISHSSHGHGHSHCHDGVPNSVSAIAWMVILGDGIHNLSDGLAIGAAFSNSITGGFSTAIAVFCHELPHEIGDFAMLLRAGMSPKQAIIYNCLSSVLCFVGMLIGVAIGNIHESSLWIFAVVGGMFLYIALVDMLPEMSSVETKKGENPFKHLFLQILGMLLGAGIMLTIALHEDQLKSALG